MDKELVMFFIKVAIVVAIITLAVVILNDLNVLDFGHHYGRR